MGACCGTDRRVAARQELEVAKAKYAKLEKETAERIGRLAIKAGLPDLDITDERLKTEFDNIASKYKQGISS